MKIVRMLSILVALLFVTNVEAAPKKLDKATFRADMRKLWEDHITWTRLYIVAATAKLPEKDAAARRLLENQQHLGDAIVPFYGQDAGDQLTTLLTDHIKIAVEIVDAAMAKDDTKKNDAIARWQTNGDDIATFLSTANPKAWPEADAKQMMREHLDLTTDELVAHLSKDWTKSVEAYDKVHEAMLKMSDMLANGIIKQFRKKFAK